MSHWRPISWVIVAWIVVGILGVAVISANAEDSYSAGYQSGRVFPLWGLGMIGLGIAWKMMKPKAAAAICPRCGLPVQPFWPSCPRCGYVAVASPYQQPLAPGQTWGQPPQQLGQPQPPQPTQWPPVPGQVPTPPYPPVDQPPTE
jgi:hypothetical protein